MNRHERSRLTRLVKIPESDIAEIKARLRAALRDVTPHTVVDEYHKGGKAARRARREEILATKVTALPAARYGIIVADPEWKFGTYSERGMTVLRTTTTRPTIFDEPSVVFMAGSRMELRAACDYARPLSSGRIRALTRGRHKVTTKPPALAERGLFVWQVCFVVLGSASTRATDFRLASARSRRFLGPAARASTARRACVIQAFAFWCAFRASRVGVEPGLRVHQPVPNQPAFRARP